MPPLFLEEIRHAICNGLGSLEITARDGGRAWTKAIKTKLCEIGHEFGYQVGAGGVDFGYGEWLYDVTWLSYRQGYTPGLQNELLSAVLVAECEWGGLAALKDDFEKLLLATPNCLRVMIYDGNYDPGANAIAERLGGYVQTFYGQRLDDAWQDESWLLAAWVRCPGTDTWEFEYYTVDWRPGPGLRRANRFYWNTDI